MYTLDVVGHLEAKYKASSVICNHSNTLCFLNCKMVNISSYMDYC